MEWKDLAEDIGKFAPLIGTAIAGPAGGAAGALVASLFGVGNDPASVKQALATNPDVAVKLAELESNQRIQLQSLIVTAEQNRLQAETAQLTSVNTTMQAEAAAEHWPTYSWRPFIGFVFGIMGLIMAITVSICYLGVMFFDQKPDVLATLPAMLGAMIGIMGVISPILGIASWHRGKMQADPNIPTINKG